MINPLLIDLPVPIKTPHLLIRPAQTGDGKLINKAVLESFNELSAWLPWADHKPTLEESETFVREAQTKWNSRTDLCLYIFDSSGKELLGATGLHRMDWSVPRFEIGYWVRTSQANKGIATESVKAVALYAFKQLNAKRVQILCEENNTASRLVAEKAGFIHEATLKNHRRNIATKQLANTLVYARYDANGLTDTDAWW